MAQELSHPTTGFINLLAAAQRQNVAISGAHALSSQEDKRNIPAGNSFSRNKIRKRVVWLGIAGALILAFVVFQILQQQGEKGSSKGIDQLSSSSGVAPSKATVVLNRNFEFAAVNKDHKSFPISFTITQIERKDEIKLKGEPRRPPKNSDFLLIRIELNNTTTQKLAFTSSDLMRLIVNEGKLAAPDYHNAQVVLDPLSFRRDLVSFIVPADKKEFSFLVGELDKKKEQIEIEF